MNTLTAIKKRLTGRDDEALQAELAKLEGKAVELRATRTREDVTEAVDRWLASARGVTSRRAIPSLAGGGLGFTEDAIRDIVASVVLASPETRSTLYRLAEPSGGLPAREERDAELEKVDWEIRDLKLELERRSVEAEKAEAAERIKLLEAKLNAAASGGDEAA